MPSAVYRTLYDLAEDQMGYVTTAQARMAGVSTESMVMMERRGSLHRTSRGVYRLVDFPTLPHAQYMQATLWPSGCRGVLSHETALFLYELSDVDPSKVHITVPTTFRIQRDIPGYLMVHRAALSAEEMTGFEGMPITTPLRSIRDCLEAQLRPDLLKQAIAQARARGLIDGDAAGALSQRLRRSAPRSAPVVHL